VEQVLMEQYQVSKGVIGEVLSEHYRVPFIGYEATMVVAPELVKGLKLGYLRRNGWVPVRRTEDGGIVVVVDDPHDLQKVDGIQQVFRGERIELAVGLRGDIEQILNGVRRGVGGPADPLAELIDAANVEEVEADEVRVSEHDSGIIRLAHQIIEEGYRARASDIHVEPYGARKETVIRFRVDGSCVEHQRLPAAFRRPLVARLKIMSQLDIAERRKPQDGKIKFRLPEREIELRVATVPTVGGEEDAVVRILTGNEAMGLEQLGMTERNLRELKGLAVKPYGLLLCVGPTGSGKTTTLHAVLGYINSADKKIWTAEDPVEITQHGLRQVQVRPKIGLTFAAAMRSFLRADPDVIMVGEMRDAETAGIGIEASLTGHLVLSTLHTNSSVETVVRLLDMGLDAFNFADALLGVLAQRLVKRLCGECKEGYQPRREEWEELRRSYGEAEWEQLGGRYEETVLYRGKGCGSCRGTGYRGRAGIHELLVATDEIKRLIQTRARVAEIFACARAEGMTTLVQDGILKTLEEVTDFRQVKAVAIK